MFLAGVLVWRFIMLNKKRLLTSLALVGALVLTGTTSGVQAAAGHHKLAAVGTSASNAIYGTNYYNYYSIGMSHAQIKVLKQNLKAWRAYGTNSKHFGNVAPITSSNGYFDQATKDNLMVFQKVKGLTADGVYGSATRNAFHASMGVSPKGFVRLKDTAHYVNYNDTSVGISADAAYRLDHSWITSSGKTAIDQIASSFYSIYGQKLQLNDASLIDGAYTPEHSSHRSGKELDIRAKFGSTAMTTAQQKKLLEIIVSNSNVERVLFHTKHGLTSSKIVVDSSHNGHIHIVFKK